MKLDITTANLKPAAEKLISRLNQMGVVSKNGQPLVVDQGFEAVAALFGRRNQHALRAALAEEARCSCCSTVPAKLDDVQIGILETLGYSVNLSDFKRPYWVHGDDASEDFPTEDEAWLAAMADARARNRFADGASVVDPQSEMTQFVAELEERWGHEHGHYTREDWGTAVALGNTKVGYWEWVAHTIESNGGDEEHCDECGAPNDDGEGWDGKCGNCADMANDEMDRSELAQEAFEAFDFQAAYGATVTVATRNGWEHTSGEPEMACAVFLEDSSKPGQPTRKVRFIVDVVDDEAVNPRVSD
jgi:hypothetical protein